MAKRHEKQDQVNSDGTLALCFVNTASEGRSRLTGYGDLLAWSSRHGGLSSDEAALLERRAAACPGEAAAAFEEAEHLLLLLSRIFNAIVDRGIPSSESIEAFNDHLARTLPPRRLVLSQSGLCSDWAARQDDLKRPLWPVAASAFSTLKSEESAMLGRCAGEGCGILFLATNPGRPRKWCDMRTCGNRAKARRRYYDKVRPYNQEILQEVDEAHRERIKARRVAMRQDD